MFLLEPDKSRVRVHMGVPMLGVQDSGFSLGYRFENVIGLLEYRMNNVQPWEYTKLTGFPACALAVMGTPQVGATISATLSGLSQYTYAMTSADMAAGDPIFSACQNFSNGFNAQYSANYIASAQPSVVFPLNAVGVGPKQWQIAFVSTGYSAFTFSTVGASGLTTFVVSQGLAPYPNTTFKEDSVTAVGYLAICDYLQSKIFTSSDLGKFTQTGKVQMRGNELGYREAIYKNARKKLSDYLGVPLYPMPPVGRFGGANTGLVV